MSELEQFTPIYQAPGSVACLGCVAAMIAGDPDLNRLAAHVGHAGESRPFKMVEVAGYLASRSILLGGYAEQPMVFGGRVSIAWPRQFLSILIVESNGRSGKHAVLWTGSAVIDPEPTNQGKKLTHYTVLQWWPVIHAD